MEKTGIYRVYKTREHAAKAFVRREVKAGRGRVIGGGWWHLDAFKGKVQGAHTLALKLIARGWLRAGEGETAQLAELQPERDELLAAARAAGTCQWFAHCQNAATGITPHIVLGDVPTCDRCHTFAGGGAR
jgi:hypothetical protein